MHRRIKAAGMHGAETLKKRRPKGRLFRERRVEPDQLASLLEGLSIAALSPVAGALALTFTP
jgi:hypothetical protein